MFGPNHYVPILRWKQAERFALKSLQPSDRIRITPLIELTPTLLKTRKRGEIQRTPDPAQVLEQEAKKLLEVCGYSPFFLDLRFVDRQIQGPRGKTHSLAYLASMVRDYKLMAVPVTGLSRSADYQSSVSQVAKADGRGVCIRITPSEVLQPGFPKEIRNALKYLGLTAKSVHLVVDHEANNPSELDPQTLLAKIPHLDKWCTLSVASGAFPPDLQSFELGSQEIPRRDWRKAARGRCQSTCN